MNNVFSRSYLSEFGRRRVNQRLRQTVDPCFVATGPSALSRFACTSSNFALDHVAGEGEEEEEKEEERLYLLSKPNEEEAEEEELLFAIKKHASVCKLEGAPGVRSGGGLVGLFCGPVCSAAEVG